MNALGRLQAEGLKLRIGPAGQLQAAPAARLTPTHRRFIAEHAAELWGELQRRVVWQIKFSDGTACTAIRPAGATRAEVLENARWQFGTNVTDVVAG